MTSKYAGLFWFHADRKGSSPKKLSSAIALYSSTRMRNIACPYVGSS